LTRGSPARIFGRGDCDEERDGAMAQPNERVKEHLEKRNVDPKDLPDSVIETLNGCSKQELKAMDKVGDSLEEANVDQNLSLSAMH
jgi:hypothetical protein